MSGAGGGPPRFSVRVRRTWDERAVQAWQVLWLVPGAPAEVVDAAYRALARMYHPDRDPEHAEAMLQINQAYREVKRSLAAKAAVRSEEERAR